MRKLWLVLTMAGTMLAAPAVAQADVDTYSCEFGPITANLQARDNQHEGGTESVITDMNQAEQPSGFPLTDEDNGPADTDGTYTASSGAPGPNLQPWLYSCTFTDGDPLDSDGASGYYYANFHSDGQYDSIVCGTGRFDSDYTAVHFYNPVTRRNVDPDAKGPLYLHPYGDIYATQSAFTIDSGHNDEPGAVSGKGYLNSTPADWADNPQNDENADWPDTYSGSTPCLDGDVEKWSWRGAFTVKVDHGS
jgi:hypothetical protein